MNLIKTWKKVCALVKKDKDLQAQIDNLPKEYFIKSLLSPNDIHNNGNVVDFASDERVDTGWSRTANAFAYTGSSDHVIGYVNINAPDVGVSNYWSRPKIRILRGADPIAVIDDLVMQQNGAYDGDATINGNFIDVTPGVDPTYTFEWFDKENRTATLIPEPFSSITLKAIK